MQSTTAGSPSATIQRLVSMDAYRGFVMLLMASEGLGLGSIAAHFPDNSFWKFVDYQISHVEWRGCALWDLIQPSFSFLVGLAVPWSIASRQAKGDGFGTLFRHTIWRSIVLVLLGVFLRSTHSESTRWTFEDTLSQIGLGYTALWLLAWTKQRTQWIAFAAILLGYWLLFALSPTPAAGFDTTTVGVPSDWPHRLTGFANHWGKNTNPAHHFDVWFLNLFSRPKPFLYNGGGYLTLSFVPTLATMLLGLLASHVIRNSNEAGSKIKTLLAWAAAGFAVAVLLDLTGICPSVKRIWTPSWVLFSGGWCLVLLSFFYWVVDVRGKRGWAFPMIVVGMNSIAMYCMAHLFDSFFRKNLRTHLGQDLWKNLGGYAAPVYESAAVLLILWCICWWMYRRKIFLKV